MRALSLLSLIGAIIVIILGLIIKILFSDYSTLPWGIMPKTYIDFTNMLLLFSIAFYLIGGKEDSDKE